MNIPWRGLCATYVLPKKLKTKNTFSLVNQSMLCQLKTNLDEYQWKSVESRKQGFCTKKQVRQLQSKLAGNPTKKLKKSQWNWSFFSGEEYALEINILNPKNTHLKRTVTFQTIMFGFQPLILPVCIGYSLSAQVSIGARYLRCISR